MLTAGAPKLAAFLERNGISKRRAARDLKVSPPTILDWLEARKVPEPPNQEAIEVYTRGEVVRADWETERDRAARERLGQIRPFDPEEGAA